MIVLALPTWSADASRAEAWRLDDALGTPEWLRLSGEQRTRFEGVANQFRPGLDENDQALALRTLVRLDVELGKFSFVGELQDSRAYLTDDDSGISTIVVDAVDLLQAYANLRIDDVVTPGSTLDLRLGRQTMDLGGRRLIARNRFRNTIQNYNGLSADWRGGDGSRLFSFFVLPVLVKPTNSEFEGLRDNDIEFDEEDEDLSFWGIHYFRPLVGGVVGEVYVYGLHESDDPSELETRDRDLYTPGIRLIRSPKRGAWDFEIETALQFGTRSATTSPADDEDLDVFAQFQLAAVGYTFDVPWQPRLSAEFDFASGESNGTDGSWNRFDSLFGPRRTEFGPTDIFGILGRENIISAGLRIGAKPNDRWDGYISWRANFLADRADFFARSGVRDPAGKSGRFAGNQIEFRSRYWVIPDSIRWELGGAAFIEGDFMDEAPNNAGFGDPLFIYTDVTFFF